MTKNTWFISLLECYYLISSWVETEASMPSSQVELCRMRRHTTMPSCQVGMDKNPDLNSYDPLWSLICCERAKSHQQDSTSFNNFWVWYGISLFSACLPRFYRQGWGNGRPWFITTDRYRIMRLKLREGNSDRRSKVVASAAGMLASRRHQPAVLRIFSIDVIQEKKTKNPCLCEFRQRSSQKLKKFHRTIPLCRKTPGCYT